MRGYFCTALIYAVLGCAALVAASPIPNYQQNYYSDRETNVLAPAEQLLLELLARYGQDLIRNHEFDNTLSKRGLDLGLSRGYSGSVAAQHRLALFAANLAGRKRRQAS